VKVKHGNELKCVWCSDGQVINHAVA